VTYLVAAVRNTVAEGIAVLVVSLPFPSDCSLILYLDHSESTAKRDFARRIEDCNLIQTLLLRTAEADTAAVESTDLESTEEE
jgi:hypothetical protein